MPIMVNALGSQQVRSRRSDIRVTLDLR